jgi:hypothetical protein
MLAARSTPRGRERAVRIDTAGSLEISEDEDAREMSSYPCKMRIFLAIYQSLTLFYLLQRLPSRQIYEKNINLPHLKFMYMLFHNLKI